MRSMFENNLLNADSYKASHRGFYPLGIHYMWAYMSARNPGQDKIVPIGLNHLLQDVFMNPITKADVREASRFYEAHGLPFPTDQWMTLIQQYGGFLPVRIYAASEGRPWPREVPFITVHSDGGQGWWIVPWIETLLVRLWYPTTVATNMYHLRNKLFNQMLETCDNPYLNLQHKVIDFGSRAATCKEQSALGGMAFLTMFAGTDNPLAVNCVKNYYDLMMAGYSIPATEHSVMMAWGQNRETMALDHIWDTYPDHPAVACVIDTYDALRFIREVACAPNMVEKIKGSGRTLVCRSDSGNPELLVPEILNALGEAYGFEENQRGYRVLPDCIRVLQSDGNNPDSIIQVAGAAKLAGWSLDNLSFGMGSGMMQEVKRDDLGISFKASYAERRDPNDGRREKIKMKKDSPGKVSLAGKVSAARYGHDIIMIDHLEQPRDPDEWPLEERYRTGKITYGVDNMANIRQQSTQINLFDMQWN